MKFVFIFLLLFMSFLSLGQVISAKKTDFRKGGVVHGLEGLENYIQVEGEKSEYYLDKVLETTSSIPLQSEILIKCLTRPEIYIDKIYIKSGSSKGEGIIQSLLIESMKRNFIVKLLSITDYQVIQIDPIWLKKGDSFKIIIDSTFDNQDSVISEISFEGH